MRALIAVLSGLAVTGVLIFIGDTSFAHVTGVMMVPDYAGASRTTQVVVLLWTFVSITLGTLVTVRIQRTNEAVAAFVVGELFFGIGLLQQFWHAPTWYSAVAILLVIPAALLGAWIGFQLRPGGTTTV